MRLDQNEDEHGFIKLLLLFKQSTTDKTRARKQVANVPRNLLLTLTF